jgi:hypothetical protein
VVPPSLLLLGVVDEPVIAATPVAEPEAAEAPKKGRAKAKKAPAVKPTKPTKAKKAPAKKKAAK